MRRTVVGLVAAALLVGSGAGQAPAAAAEDWAPPVLTSPAPDALLVGTAELTATSESPYVVFELASSASTIVRRTPVAAGADGVFRDTLPAVGLYARFHAQVRACSDVNLESCTTVSEPVSVRGPQPTLTSTEPLPSVIDPTVVGRVSLRVTNLGGFPATVTGDVPRREVRDGDLVDINLAGLSSARVTVRLQQCNPLNRLSCTSVGRILTVRRAPDLTLWGPSAMLVSQNGDGLSESATSKVSLDADIPVTARWRIVSKAGATVAGPYEFTAAEITAGRKDRVDIAIDPRARLGRPLPAGEYRFEVETTATAPGFTKSTRKSETLYVSNAAPLTRLTPKTSAFYPQAVAAERVPRVMELSPWIDYYEARLTSFRYRVLTDDGKLVGDPVQKLGWDSRVIAWDGTINRLGLPPRTAPEGTYRIELIRTVRSEDGAEVSDVYGPVSAPFTLRHGYPPSVATSVTSSARSSWQRTVAKRNARVQRVKGGALRLQRKAGGKAPGRVTTAHSVRIPGDRIKERQVQVRLRGAWGNRRDVKIAVIAPWGDIYPRRSLTRSRKNLEITVPHYLVRADGRLQFKVQWKGKKPVRLDQFVVTYRKYDLRS